MKNYGKTAAAALLILSLLLCPLLAFAEEAEEEEDAYTEIGTEEFLKIYRSVHYSSSYGANYAPDWESTVFSPHSKDEIDGVQIEICDILADPFGCDLHVRFTSDQYELVPADYLMFADTEDWSPEDRPADCCFVQVSVRDEDVYREPEARDYYFSEDRRVFDYIPSYIEIDYDGAMEVRVDLMFWKNGREVARKTTFTYPEMPLPVLDSVRFSGDIINEALNVEVSSITFTASAKCDLIRVRTTIPKWPDLYVSMSWEKIRPRIYTEDGTVLYDGSDSNNTGAYVSRFPDTVYLCWYDRTLNAVAEGTEVVRLVRDGNRLVIDQPQAEPTQPLLVTIQPTPFVP